MDSLKFKRTKTKGKKPTDLTEGEIALNLADRTVLCQHGSDTVEMLGSIEQRYGMPKSVFEANRNANRQKYAGSGFANFGGSLASDHEFFAGYGLAAVGEYSTSKNTLYLGRKADETNDVFYRTPLLHIDGIMVHVEHTEGLYNDNTSDWCSQIALPPAPRGYETYDSSSRTFINHLTHKSDHYPDADGQPTAASDKNEAVIRAFSGLCIDPYNIHGLDNWEVQSASDSDSSFSVEEGSIKWTLATKGTGNESFRLKQLSEMPIGNYVVEFYCVTNASGCGFYSFTGGDSSQTYYTHYPIEVGFNRITFSRTKDDTYRFPLYFQTNAKDGSTLEIHSVRCYPEHQTVITDRSDLAYFEIWAERVDKYDLFQPFGNSQYSKATFGDKSLTDIWNIAYDTKEVVTENDNGTTTTTTEDVKIGKGYGKFGAWQDDSEVKAKGLQWSKLTDTEKAMYLQNPIHNLYWDSDENCLVQIKYRTKSVSGYGNNWQVLTPSASTPSLSLRFGNSQIGHNEVLIQADSDTASDDFSTDWNDGAGIYTGKGHGSLTIATFSECDPHVFIGTLSGGNTPNAHKGISYCLPIAQIQRLNQGAFSPKNWLGTSAYCLKSSANQVLNGFWWRPNSIAEPLMAHFLTDIYSQPYKHYVCYGTGNIDTPSSSKSGRPTDVLYQYHDTIYSGLVRDLRLDCRLQDPQALLERASLLAFQSLGLWAWESAPMSGIKNYKFDHYGDDKNSNWSDLPTTGVHTTAKLARQSGDAMNPNGVRYFGVVINGNNRYPVCNYYTDYHNHSRDFFFVESHEDFTPITKEINYGESLELYYVETDVVPNDKQACFHFMPVADFVGSADQFISLLNTWYETEVPAKFLNAITYDTTATDINFSRKIKGEVRRTYYDETTSSFTESGITEDKSGNSYSATLGSGHYGFYHYTSMGVSTESSSYLPCYHKMPYIFVSGHNSKTYGCNLGYSLTKNIMKGSANYALGTPNVTQFGVPSGRWYLHNNTDLPAKHGEIPTFGSISEDGYKAYKCWVSLTEKDQKWYAQFQGSELIYSTTNSSFGDDGKIPIVNGESTKTDDNGNTLKTFTHISKMPLGIANNIKK